MDHSLDFVELLGVGGVIRGVSSAITPLAGYAPADLVGRHYRDIIHPDDCELAARAFDQVLVSGHAGPITLRYRHNNGAWRTIRASARNFLADPSARAIVVLTRDLTDQLHAERLLSDANAELHRLSHRLIAAHESERNHLARELHDDVGQILVGLTLSMASKTASADGVPSRHRVDRWRELAQQALDHLRRLVLDLRPPILDQQGLVVAVSAHIDRIRPIASADIQFTADSSVGRLAPEVEIACFRIIQESLTNAVKYSGASHLLVTLRCDGMTLVAIVQDDGRGFDVTAARDAAMRGDSVGLLSMRERAALVGGHLALQSAPGHGTEVRATFPIIPANPGATD
jgi:PAS domain S-box-containing protein